MKLYYFNDERTTAPESEVLLAFAHDIFEGLSSHENLTFV